MVVASSCGQTRAALPSRGGGGGDNEGPSPTASARSERFETAISISIWLSQRKEREDDEWVSRGGEPFSRMMRIIVLLREEGVSPPCARERSRWVRKALARSTTARGVVSISLALSRMVLIGRASGLACFPETALTWFAPGGFAVGTPILGTSGSPFRERAL